MSHIVDFYKRTVHFFTIGIWQATEHELSKTRRFFYRFAKIMILSIRGFIKERLTIRSSALTYSILFAMIPLFALMIAIGKGFGVEKMIEDSLEGTFIGQADLTPTVMGFVQRYLESTQQGIFIGVGIAILFYSVVNFFMQVENAFNTIWHVKKLRSPMNMFTTYFSTVLIIPVVIVIAGGFSIYVSSAVSQTYVYQVLSPVLRFFMKLIPYALLSGVFTLMYLAIPNTRVRLSSAMIAGVVAGCAFEAFQMLYINGQVYLSRYNVVYGGFAAIPLLLLWLNISCLIILLGAEISYVAQHLNYFEHELEAKIISPRYKNFLTLFILYSIVKQFEEQKPALSAEHIEKEYKLPVRMVNKSLKWLQGMALITEVTLDKSKDKHYMPAFDIHQMTVQMVTSRMDRFGAEDFINSKNKTLSSFRERALHYCERNSNGEDDRLIKDL